MAHDASISGTIREALREMTSVLDQHRFLYALIGGIATSFRSQPRFTKGVDLLLNVPQIALPALLEDLRQRGFELDLGSTVDEWNRHHCALIKYRGIPIDWLKPVISAYAHVLERATQETFLDQRIRIACTEGLILLKLIAFRTQDQLDIENLVAANPSVDLEWLESEWKNLASLDDPRMLRLLELVGKSGQN